MSRSRASIAATLGCALLLICGCGDQLDSRYGVTSPGSINGCAVLHEVFKGRTDLRDAEVIGPRLEEDGELFIHVARTQALPDADACTWVRGWLRERDGRQAVLILRGGSLTSWLCRRWAEEARAEARRLPAEAAKLDAIAEQLERRAQAEEREKVFDLKSSDCPLFSLKRQPPVVPTGISGLGLSEVPLAMRITGSLSVAAKASAAQDAEATPATDPGASPVTAEDHQDSSTLIALTTTLGTGGVEATPGSVPWAIAIPHGESRLVVVLDALPLLDGAQPDAAARTLLHALVDEVTSFHGGQPHTTWVRWLRVRGEGGPPNPMLAVLTSPPISYISWHFVVFLVVLALAGAAWLGRREAPAESRHDRFSRHVLALATRLRDGRHAAWCARAIARAALRHRQPPPALLDDAEARRWLLSLTDAAADKRPSAPPPSASTRGSHDHRDSTDS